MITPWTMMPLGMAAAIMATFPFCTSWSCNADATSNHKNDEWDCFGDTLQEAFSFGLHGVTPYRLPNLLRYVVVMMTCWAFAFEFTEDIVSIFLLGIAH